MALPKHFGPPVSLKTYFIVDEFNRGGLGHSKAQEISWVGTLQEGTLEAGDHQSSLF